MSRRNSGTVAPYGQACRNCFKSKCKCIARAEGDACERCYRLRKDCIPSDSVRQRNAVKEANSAARIAQLESKLDSLVSLLRPVGQSSHLSIDLREAPEGQLLTDDSRQQPHEAERLLPLPTPAASCGTGSVGDASRFRNEEMLRPIKTPASASSSVPIDQPSVDEAEIFLRVFRDMMLPSFPFVHIHPGMTVDQLRKERPFFFQAIIAVTSPTIDQKLARGTELKRYLAQNMLVEFRSDIDLLLGLLTYIAWSFDQFLNKTASLSRLMQLAMSVVFDLRLNKAKSQETQKVSLFYSQGHAEHSSEKIPLGPLEKERAVLGCFFLSAIVSSYLGQIDVMRWTSRMEEYLVLVEASKECSNDETFAAQIRLQLFAQKMIEVRERYALSHSDLCKAGAIIAFPDLLYIKTIQAQLQDFRLSLSPSLQQQDLLKLHLLYTDLLICEAAHPSSSDCPLVPPYTRDTVTTSPVGFQPLECYWRSVMNIKSYFEIFSALPPSVCRGLAFPIWTHMLRCVMVLYRLSTHPDPTWDCQTVRKMVNLVQILQDLVRLTKQAGIEAGEHSEHDLFARFAEFLHAFQGWVYAVFTPGESASGTAWPYNNCMLNRPNLNMMINQSPAELKSMDLGNNLWLGNIFGWS